MFNENVTYQLANGLKFEMTRAQACDGTLAYDLAFSFKEMKTELSIVEMLRLAEDMGKVTSSNYIYAMQSTKEEGEPKIILFPRKIEAIYNEELQQCVVHLEWELMG